MSSVINPAYASSTYGDGAWLTFGASDGTTQAASGIVGDGSDTTADRFSNDAKIVQAPNTSGTVIEEATVAFDGTDAKVTFSESDANEFNYMSFSCP